MVIYSVSVSMDGFIADRDGEFGWTVPIGLGVMRRTLSGSA